LGALVTGLMVPYLGAFMPANETSVEVYQVLTQFSAVEVSPQAFVEEKAPVFTWMNLLWAIYLFGGLVVFSRFLHGLKKIYIIYKNADKTPLANYTLIESDSYHLPFSFFHFIFISKQLPLNNEIEKILKHEELHANQWHSIDIVFTEILQVFFWFNPILIFYKRALRQSHEYLADAYVTQDHNKNSYGQLLLQQSTSGLEIALANQFFHSQIKKRITMMYKEKSKRSAMIKYLAAIPVLLAMLFIFSSNQSGELYNKEDLRKEFASVYESMAPEQDALEEIIKWDNLLNKYATEENIDLISADFKDVASEFGIFLNVGEKEPNQPYKFSPFITLFPSDKLDKFRNDQEFRETYQKELKNFSNLIGKEVSFDIKVEANGTYTFPNTDKDTDDLSTYFRSIHNEGRSIRLELDPNAPTKDVNKILNCASKNQVGVILNLDAEEDGNQTITVLSNGAYMQDGIPLTNKEVLKIIDEVELDGFLKIKTFNGSKWSKVNALMELASDNGIKTILETSEFKTTNFDGRKITQRNWESITKYLKLADGTVAVKAEANAKGEIIYVEVDSEQSTITDKEILKQALKAAKGYRIEAGDGTAKGSIIFNFSSKGDQTNYHDQYIKEYNYGESNEDNSIHDLIYDFTNNDPIFKVVEEMPRFPGCEEMEGNSKEKEQCAKQKMLEFIYSNLKYPAKARDASIEGMCVVQFIIEKDGSVRKAKIVRDIGAGCGEETLKVVNNFPTWIPGKQKGKAVRVQYTLPVKFKLEGNTQEKEVAKIVAAGKSNQKSKAENLVIGEKTELKADIFKVVQEMPRFSGCEDMIGTAKEKEECAKGKMLEYIYSNIKYPKEARAKGIDGMSVIRMVIEKDGSVSNVSTLRDPGAGTGAEAARVVREMPIWIPGKQNGKPVRVQYTLPVKFKLEGDDKPTNIDKLLKGKASGVSISGDGDKKIRLKTSNYSGPDPLFVVDGKIREGGSIESLKPEDIESVNVLKGEKAKDKYGEKGAYGVVEITMKAKNVKKEKTYKTSLTYTADQFKKIKDISYLLRDVGRMEESKADVVKFTLVKAEKETAYIEHSNDGKFNTQVVDLTSKAKTTDRFFFEEITINKNGKEENIGTISIKIVDGLPSFRNSLVVVNEKTVSSDWMNNINPEDIEKMEILKGDKMIEKYGAIEHNSVVEITLKPGKKLTKYLIDGQLFGYDYYKTIDKSHINKEEPASLEEKFMRGISGELIKVNMLAGYGFNSAYFPGTNTADGSDQALLTFVGDNIKYPKTAMDNNIEGVVSVWYTVNADGSLTNFKIGKSLGWGLDRAVLDMMKKLAKEKGKWKAAYLDRRSVASTMVLPVKFKLQDSQKKEVKSTRLSPIKFSANPNPSNGKFNVEYQLGKNQPASLVFYSIEGKILKKMQNLPAENNITVDLSGQNTSVIYISLEQGGKVITIKASVQK
jgi:TonB family protein